MQWRTGQVSVVMARDGGTHERSSHASDKSPDWQHGHRRNVKTEMLAKVNAAVQRIDDGTYGTCVDCDETISALRLRATPFAVRCKGCEQTREIEQRRKRIQSQRAPQPGLAMLLG